MHLADGVALWERYNRSGLTGLVGVDTFVVSYESIVEDPMGHLETLASWLGDLEQFARLAPHWDPSRAAASISPRLRHQQSSGDPEPLLGEHQDLVEQLDSLDGPHRPLTSPPTGAESAWTTALLDDRRHIGLLRTTVTEYEALLDTGRREAKRLHAELDGARIELANMHRLYERMRASTSWRVTRPLRQVASLKNREGTAPGD
jgi:hypothetical protein